MSISWVFVAVAVTQFTNDVRRIVLGLALRSSRLLHALGLSFNPFEGGCVRARTATADTPPDSGGRSYSTQRKRPATIFR